MEKNERTAIYDAFRNVPKSAQKTIAGGPLKGFTDINPMWRIKRLTEVFGPCGKGWKIEDVKFWSDSKEDEAGAFCSLNLYVKYGEEWSAPIFGVGGSHLIVSDKNGIHLDDESYKKAYTDAISIACKALGMCADIYFAADVKTRDNVTKYDTAPATPAAPAKPQAPAGKPQITDAQFEKVMARLGKGEKSLIDKVRQTYTLTEEQATILKQYE